MLLQRVCYVSVSCGMCWVSVRMLGEGMLGVRMLGLGVRMLGEGMLGVRMLVGCAYVG